MKRSNRCDEIVKFLSATKCYVEAMIDVAAVKFRFSAVKFVENLMQLTKRLAQLDPILVPITTPLICL